MAALLDGILRLPRFLLVLDDSEVIREHSIVRAIEALLANQPENAHLVMVTREDPSLPLARLRANNQVTEILAADLRFREPEAERFLNQVLDLSLSQPDVAALANPRPPATIGFVTSSYGEANTLNGRVLVAYASQHRSTAGVADAIGKQLAGAAVDVRRVGALCGRSPLQEVPLPGKPGHAHLCRRDQGQRGRPPRLGRRPCLGRQRPPAAAAIAWRATLRPRCA